jgi:ubiquinone/menaquinone biosynthesis C-methylase UbiE
LQHFQEERRDRGYQYVEFRLGEIENLPVADNTTDVVISNLRDQSLAE